MSRSASRKTIDGGGRYSIFAPNIIGSAKFSPGGWRAAEGGKNGSLLELEIADGNSASSTAGARLDIIGIEADYDGPSYVADNTSLLLSARKFDFSNLFKAIGENDIGTPRLTDVIVKSVTDLNDDHRLELLAIHAGEDYKRTVENALESENFEDVGHRATSKQDSTLLGVTWRWSPGEVAQLRNTFYYRNSDTTGTQGEAYPDLAGPNPTPATTPVRENILRIKERETEIGWRSDFSTMLGSDGIFSAGAQVARVDLDFDRRLSGDWTRYVYDQSDFRADPAQQYIVLTPGEFNSTLSAAETQIAAYADYAWTIGDFTWTPGMRYERDGFSGKSVVAPRLLLSWQPDAVTRVWTGGGVYYQAPRYLDIAADPSNLDLKSERSTQLVLGFSRYLREDLRFSAEGYYQKLDDLIVFDDRTTNTATNIGEGSATGVDLMLAKRMSRGWSASATYSYSRARRDDKLGEGEYASDWDRPHAFGIVGAWQPSDRWTFSAKWKYASGRPTDAFVVHSDVLGDAGPVRYSKELTRTNAERLPAYHSLSLRADYQRRFGPLSLVAYLDILNVYGRKNGNAYEWDERRGVNIIEGLDEALPTIGLRFEYSWTPGMSLTSGSAATPVGPAHKSSPAGHDDRHIHHDGEHRPTHQRESCDRRCQQPRSRAQQHRGMYRAKRRVKCAGIAQGNARGEDADEHEGKSPSHHFVAQQLQCEIACRSLCHSPQSSREDRSECWATGHRAGGLKSCTAASTPDAGRSGVEAVQQKLTAHGTPDSPAALCSRAGTARLAARVQELKPQPGWGAAGLRSARADSRSPSIPWCRASRTYSCRGAASGAGWATRGGSGGTCG